MSNHTEIAPVEGEAFTTGLATVQGPMGDHFSRSEAGRLLSSFLADRPTTTVRAYKAALRHFSQHVAMLGDDLEQIVCGILQLAEAKRLNETVRLYHSRMKAQEFGKCADNSANLRVAAIRSLMNEACELDISAYCVRLRKARTEKASPPPGPNPEQLDAILETARNQTHTKRDEEKTHTTPKVKKSARDYAMIHLAFSLALRRAELTGLDMEHLDLNGGTLSILGKGRTRRQTMHMPPQTIDALRDWIEHRGTDAGPLFTHIGSDVRLSAGGFYTMLREISERAGNKTRPHLLRAASATQAAIMLNGDLAKLKAHTRHMSMDVCASYVRLDDKVQRNCAQLVAASLAA